MLDTYYSALTIEQNFILNCAFLKILLEILSESNAVVQCCTSSLSHFVYSWQGPKQNADCQSCSGKGMLSSAQSFISCSQLEAAELSLSTPELTCWGWDWNQPSLVFMAQRASAVPGSSFPPLSFPLCMFLLYFGIDPAAPLRHTPRSPHKVR